MAKRKRLLPAQNRIDETGPAAPTSDHTPDPGAPPLPRTGLETKAMFPLGVARHAPISRVTGDASTAAALQELSDAMRAAREEGRLVQSIPLSAVDADHLVRDRQACDEDELSVLIESLRARGQQTPIEVVALADGHYGLISGWRRITALARLHTETGDARFSKVDALLRRPQDAPAAYLAMVEENEIRVGLSYYERARIVTRATAMGVFPDETQALRHLFASASRAKRSKIGSFLPICHALDSALRHPAAISERLGLALSKALVDDADLGRKLAERLRKAAPATPAAEIATLQRALRGGVDKGRVGGASRPASDRCETRVSVMISARAPGELRLTGPGVTAAFRKRLQDWLGSLEQDI